MDKSRESMLYFCREEKALTLAVRCWNALQLKEVEKDLNLQGHIRDNQTRTGNPTSLSHYPDKSFT